MSTFIRAGTRSRECPCRFLSRPLRYLIVAMGLALGLMAGAVPLHAQARRDSPPAPSSPQPSPSLRLSPATRAAIDQLVDSLAAEHLPGDVLRDKVAEGVLKGADDARILLAVRSLASRLRDGRSLLGPSATEDELKAAASALFVGVEPRDISRLVEAQRKRGTSESSLTMSLTVVAELALRRVPAELAVSSVESLLQRGARDTDLRAFRITIERDLQQGKPPRDAITSGVRTTLNGMGRTPE